jgi:hypothetical protein
VNVDIWSKRKSAAARSIVRRSVAEALAAVLDSPSPFDEESTVARDEGARMVAAELVRRLSLPPIGREVVAGRLRDLLTEDHARDLLPEPRR